MDSTHVLHKVPELANRGEKNKSRISTGAVKKMKKRTQTAILAMLPVLFFPSPVELMEARRSGEERSKREWHRVGVRPSLSMALALGWW